MERKKLTIALLLAIFAFVPIVNTAAQSNQENMMSAYHQKYAGLIIDINATCEANPGENINITIHIEAYTEIINCYVYLNVFGLENGTCEKILANITCMENVSLAIGIVNEINYNVAIPSNVYGVTYGQLWCKWAIKGDPPLPVELPSTKFPMTNIKNIELERLRGIEEAYNTLNRTYTDVLEERDELKENNTKLMDELNSLRGQVTELGNMRSAMIVLAIISVIFVFTTIYLMIRKPKSYW